MKTLLKQDDAGSTATESQATPSNLSVLNVRLRNA